MVAVSVTRFRLATLLGRPAYSTPGLQRFTAAHSLAAAGDGFVAVSLAGSLFFSISPEASRDQVLLYLVVNLVPFTLLAPFIGPLIDRSRRSHRLLVSALYAIRAVLAIGLAVTLFDLGFYFFALALLIAGKASGVTRQALVPTLVERPEHLVAANSRLAASESGRRHHRRRRRSSDPGDDLCHRDTGHRVHVFPRCERDRDPPAGDQHHGDRR